MKIEMTAEGSVSDTYIFLLMDKFFNWLDDQFEPSDKDTPINKRENYLTWNRVAIGDTTGHLWHQFASKEPAELDVKAMRLMMNVPCEESDLNDVHIYYTKNFAFKFVSYDIGACQVCYSTLEVYDDTVEVAMKLYFDLPESTGSGAITI